MKHASLFTGIGGFDLSAQWMGWENVFQCEIDKFCTKVLEKNFPNVKRYGDITKTDFTLHRGEIDILTGGFPCQPFSIAGKRKGAEDDRFLWHEMLRAIREIQPSWIIAENVGGLITQGNGLVFEQVCSEMEEEGYEVQPFIIPACAVNAPHRRDRVWFVAYSNDRSFNERSEQGVSEWNKNEITCSTTTENTVSVRRDGEESKEESEVGRFRKPGAGDGGIYPESITTDSTIRRRKEFRTQSKTTRDACVSRLSNATDTEYSTPSRQQRNSWEILRESESDRLDYGDWEMDWYEVATRLCGVANGLPNRVDRLKGLGNAIVPQVAFEIFRAIEQTEILMQNKPTYPCSTSGLSTAK